MRKKTGLQTKTEGNISNVRGEQQHNRTTKFQHSQKRNVCHFPDLEQDIHKKKWWVEPSFTASQASRFNGNVKYDTSKTISHDRTTVKIIKNIQDREIHQNITIRHSDMLIVIRVPGTKRAFNVHKTQMSFSTLNT